TRSLQRLRLRYSFRVVLDRRLRGILTLGQLSRVARSASAAATRTNDHEHPVSQGATRNGEVDRLVQVSTLQAGLRPSRASFCRKCCWRSVDEAETGRPPLLFAKQVG